MESRAGELEIATSFFDRAAQLASSGRPFALATVVRTLGSTPQVVGAKLLVTDDEQVRPIGTLGGGCVEADAILSAREAILTGVPSLRAYELTEDLAWNTGLVCGGTMWILAERGGDALSAGGENIAAHIATAAAGGPPVAWVTRLRRESRGFAFDGRVFVLADGTVRGDFGDGDALAGLKPGATYQTERPASAGHDAVLDRATREALAQMRHGTARLIALDETHDLLIEPVTGRPRIVIAGGGHVAKAIARQAQLLDFDVTVLEDRPEFADPARFDGATVINEDVPHAIAGFTFGWQSYLVIATRGHKLDADCVLAAVKTDVAYIGLLGSRRKTILIAELLREQGVDESRIAVIHAPVGLDLGGRTPAEIALSVMAEITARRYRGSGNALSQVRS